MSGAQRRAGFMPPYRAWNVQVMIGLVFIVWAIGSSFAEAYIYKLGANKKSRFGRFHPPGAISNNGWMATTCLSKAGDCPIDILRKVGNKWKWNQAVKAANYPPHHVAMSNNGAVLAAGLDGKGCAGGRVFLFRRKGTGKFTKHQTILSPDSVNGCNEALFGKFVDLSKDGAVLAIASHQEDPNADPSGSSVFIYTKRPSNKWAVQARFRRNASTNTISLSGNGKTLAIRDALESSIRFAERLTNRWTIDIALVDPAWLSTIEFQLSSDGLILAVRSTVTIAVFARPGAGQPFTPRQSIVAWSASNLVGRIRLLDDASRILYSTNHRNASFAVTVLDRDATTGNYSTNEDTALGGSDEWGRLSSVLLTAPNGKHLSLLVDDDYYGYRAVYVFDRVPTKAPTRPKPSICRPSGTLKKNQCMNRIAKCNSDAHNQPMKWTGAGCKKNGKPRRDGGCRCKGYCGYKCRKSCEADAECRWKGGKCVVDETGQPSKNPAEC